MAWAQSSSTMSLHQVAAALQRFAEELRVSVLTKALQEHVLSVERAVKEDVQGTDIARGLTGRHGQGKNGRLKARPPIRAIYAGVYTKDEYAGRAELEVRMWGMAALIELGGRTKDHTIAPSSSWTSQLGKASQKKAARLGLGARALRFPDGGFRRFPVHHPGSTIRAHGIAATTLRSIEPAVAQSVDRQAAEAARAVGL